MEKKTDILPGFGFDSGYYPVPPLMRNQHAHQDVELNFSRRGTITYFLNGKAVVIPAGRWCAFWAAIGHQMVRIDGAREFFWVTVPLADVLSWPISESFLQGLLEGRLAISSAPPNAGDPSPGRWHRWLHHRDEAWRQIALLEIQARLRALALERPWSGAKRSPSAALPAGLRPAEKIARYVAEHYREEIGAADAARASGLHAHYAMGLFRRVTGQSVLECLTHHRLSHAQRLLATTDRKVIDIAAESGFRSLSRFYAAFVGQCGQTPRAYRARLAAGPSHRVALRGEQKRPYRCRRGSTTENSPALGQA